MMIMMMMMMICDFRLLTCISQTINRELYIVTKRTRRIRGITNAALLVLCRYDGKNDKGGGGSNIQCRVSIFVSD